MLQNRQKVKVNPKIKYTSHEKFDVWQYLTGSDFFAHTSTTFQMQHGKAFQVELK